MKRIQLDDGVSAELEDGGGLLLETHEHAVYLSPAAYTALVMWMSEQLEQPGDDIAKAIEHERDFR